MEVKETEKWASFEAAMKKLLQTASFPDKFPQKLEILSQKDLPDLSEWRKK